LTTILPGAVFGPILTAANLGSVRIIARMLSGSLPGAPRIGLEVVDGERPDRTERPERGERVGPRQVRMIARPSHDFAAFR
jgi:hypothetical protein